MFEKSEGASGASSWIRFDEFKDCLTWLSMPDPLVILAPDTLNAFTVVAGDWEDSEGGNLIRMSPSSVLYSIGIFGEFV